MEVDELEPFRKAAELGCPDFRWNENIGLPEFDIFESWQALPMDGEEKVNRYASAVCAEWWWQRGADDANSGYLEHMQAARAFGRKYGAQ